MPIYKQTTEITNIDDLLSSVERDIEEVYFGDKNVFTVWAEYDGTLPAQYAANGSTLVDYRIYGSAGGVGEEVDITGLSEPLCGIGAYTDSLDLSTGALARRIKKFIVTGEENWVIRAGQPSNIYFIEFYSTNFIRNKALCTHYINQESGFFDQLEDKHCLVALSSDGIRSFIGIRDSSYNSAAAFISYLKAQYAAGTPVILWCVLANEEPATITVPSGLTGTLEGYLVQDGTPTPQTPIYPTANGVKQADDTYSIKYGYKLDMGVRSANLFEVESNMRSSLNWALNPPFGTSARVYFINYKLSDAATQELKKGIHTCSIFEHFTDGYTPNLLVCAFSPTLTSTVTEEYRILTNQGIISAKTFDFSEWQDIYLIIGYGNGFDTESSKQQKIDELFGNWRISIVEGSIAPTEYQPYSNTTTPIYVGDEPLGEDEYISYGEQKVYRRTEQLFNAETAVYKNGVYKNDYGSETSYPMAGYYETYIPITPGETIYVINVSGNTNLTVRLYFYNAQKQWISRSDGYLDDFSVVAPSNAAYAQLQISLQFIHSPNTIMITQGSTAPSTYIPYLQPEDPPVPLPALPTVDGTTITDYAGQSAAVPSRFVAKYRKEGFN